VQVLRMQPGGQVQLFDGRGGEWLATVTEMGRKVVTVAVGEAVPSERELSVQVTLAMGMPANDRMDALVEKAAELGVHAIQPLLCERSVLRLDGERAAKKVAHWQAVAVSACEQCGRAVVPQVHEVKSLAAWLRGAQAAPALEAGGRQRRGVLSLREAVTMRAWLGADAAQATAGATSAQRTSYVFLSGPEGGLSPTEEALALEAGWTALTLGPRVLRADTAPLAALSVIGSVYEG
jgi:16S rRNA (uracil1498-N3)-methyltransferase